MKALILAAGQGTRLGHLTKNRPKPMLPIGGRPLLQHTVEWLRDYGIKEIAINLHHRPDVVMEFFGDGAHLGVAIHYSDEKELLGTAGAAKRLEPYFDEDFVVVYGDVLTNLDLMRLINFHNQQGNHGRELPTMTLALYNVPDLTQCGLVETDTTGYVTRFVEKPAPDQVFTDLAFSGIMICRPAIFKHIPIETFFDFGHDLIPALLAADAPMSAQVIAKDEYVIDIGTLPGYLTALQTCPQYTLQKAT
jgi:mannose-1-phosphate guanylyltransferase